MSWQLVVGLIVLAAPLSTAQPVSPAGPGRPAELGNLEETLKDIFDHALRINIVARVQADGTQPVGAQPILNVERSQLTLPGHSVAVRFDGSNIRVQANLTPYLQNDGKLMLVAQGEVWVAEPTSAEKAVRYLSSIKSLPVSLGEKVVFFPLGIPDAVQGTNRFNLTLEIQIVSVDQQSR